MTSPPGRGSSPASRSAGTTAAGESQGIGNPALTATPSTVRHGYGVPQHAQRGC
ncbi:hypothetical protein ACFXPX_07520 [Kitasatospora sp. NPDC059146]|uniref:hypothetical protein n=1 Tax=Kitasatospora sp. NPDC059146 TaxID=3346741 RepID=UPI0036CA23F8